MLVGPLQFGGLPRDHSCWHRHSSPKWELWRSEIGAGSKLWPFEAVLSFNHFYQGKLGKTGRLLLWKCAWGSCMTDTWTSLLSCPWRSWIGPGLKLVLFAVWIEKLHPLAASCLGNLHEFAAITADRLMQRPLTWTSLASAQQATPGKLFDMLDRTRIGYSWMWSRLFSHIAPLNVHVSRPTAVWRAAQGS